jgi:hypothetical protein
MLLARGAKASARFMAPSSDLFRAIAQDDAHANFLKKQTGVSEAP